MSISRSKKEKEKRSVQRKKNFLFRIASNFKTFSFRIFKNKTFDFESRRDQMVSKFKKLINWPQTSKLLKSKSDKKNLEDRKFFENKCR